MINIEKVGIKSEKFQLVTLRRDLDESLSLMTLTGTVGGK